ncbi:MAG: hypothetical protein HFI90_09905 [Clostridia bacterium]|nr:hypothetical protein [Clostridia bacterium]
MKKYTNSPNYTSAIIVAHGDCEKQIARHIKSNLRLNMYIHKRTTSIQINGLLDELKTNFKDTQMIQRNDSIAVEVEKNKIKNLKIFTIMDTDDCSEKTRERYKNKPLFEGYVLRDYVAPIYMSPKLEVVLYECGLIPKIYKGHEKRKAYGKLFPITAAPKSGSKMNEMKKLSDILRPNKNTNMEIFIDYCIEQAESKKVI